MDKKKIYREVFSFVLPLAIQNFMSALVGASDALMLGMLAAIVFELPTVYIHYKKYKWVKDLTN